MATNMTDYTNEQLEVMAKSGGRLSLKAKSEIERRNSLKGVDNDTGDDVKSASTGNKPKRSRKQKEKPAPEQTEE